MKVTYESHLAKIIKQIESGDLIARKKAAQHLTKRMRKNISSRGIPSPGDFPKKYTGNLVKGIGYKTTQKGEVIAGARSSHAHLLEFRHRTAKSGSLSNKFPFFVRTFEEEKGEMIDIMSKKWF